MEHDEPRTGAAVARPAGSRVPRPAGAVPGARAPWRPAGRRVGLAAVRRALAGKSSRDARTSRPPGAAAVLVPVFEEAGDARVVLTRRSYALRSHTGQVAFPGGRLEPGESALDAALREAAEEVGIDGSAVEVLGELTPLSTVSSSASVAPFVGALPGRPTLRPNPAEVERVFDVAVGDLLAEGAYRQELWGPSGEQARRAVHFFYVAGETVWGATAQILFELLGLVTAEH